MMKKFFASKYMIKEEQLYMLLFSLARADFFFPPTSRDNFPISLYNTGNLKSTSPHHLVLVIISTFFPPLPLLSFFSLSLFLTSKHPKLHWVAFYINTTPHFAIKCEWYRKASHEGAPLSTWILGSARTHLPHPWRLQAVAPPRP